MNLCAPPHVHVPRRCLGVIILGEGWADGARNAEPEPVPIPPGPLRIRRSFAVPPSLRVTPSDKTYPANSRKDRNAKMALRAKLHLAARILSVLQNYPVSACTKYECLSTAGVYKLPT